MLLLLALVCLAGAVFAVSEVATYPARLKERSLKRAADYGRTATRVTDLELLRFRERVLLPTVEKLAAIPLRLNPRMKIEAIQKKLLAAGLAQRLSTQGFLAIKGAAMVGGAALGLL